MMKTCIEITEKWDSVIMPTGHNSASGNSNVEINRLSSEWNSRLSREMDEMMTSVNVQIQRAISDAISNQVLSQIQNALKAG